MDNLEKYLDQVMEKKPVAHETPIEVRPEEEPQAKPDLLRGVARRWYIVVATTVVLCALGLPAIWLSIEPGYEVRGAVEVKPAESILTGTTAGEGSSRLFINTQADKLRSDPSLLNDIANSLVDRKLAFFSGEPRTLLEKLKAKITPSRKWVDLVDRLRQALTDGTISIGSLPNSQLLAVSMTSNDAEGAKVIVHAFLTNYRTRYGRATDKQDQDDLKALMDEQERLARDLDAQRAKISDAAQIYGSISLDRRHEMELSRQAELLSGLTRLQSQESILLARLGQLGGSMDPNALAEPAQDQLTAARSAYVNAHPTVVAISAQIAEINRELIVARQVRKPGHPILTQQEGVLADLEQSLEDKRAELDKKFDKEQQEREKIMAAQQHASIQTELDQVRTAIDAHEKLLTEQEGITREIGNTNLKIQNLQAELEVFNTMYETVTARIRRIAVEGQGRPRITAAYDPAIINTVDKRAKFSAGVFCLAVGCGIGLALLRDKTDKTLQTADDVTRELDMPVLGTTSSSHTIKPSLFAEQIAADYQTIRTNLGLLTNGGIPRKLAVSSPGMREGKTTFAVNLATSLAKGGKKVLLIDGDLRKPDVRYMLNVTNGAGGVQDVLMGADAEKAICSVSTSGLHVLVANSRNVADVYELLASSRTAEQIEGLGREYDHLIIDTPPVLGFPDALIWARLAGAVVLVGFAGQTTAPELKEAKEKFARVRVQVLGAILSNVRAEQNVYRYAYSYRASGVEAVRKARRQRKLLLSPQGPPETAKTRST